MAVVLQQLILKFMQYISRRRQRNLPPTTPPPTPVAEKETSLVNVRLVLFCICQLVYCMIDLVSYYMRRISDQILKKSFEALTYYCRGSKHRKIDLSYYCRRLYLHRLWQWFSIFLTSWSTLDRLRN